MGVICPHCAKGELQLIPEQHPHNIEHLVCLSCYSTFTLEGAVGQEFKRRKEFYENNGSPTSTE